MNTKTVREQAEEFRETDFTLGVVALCDELDELKRFRDMIIEHYENQDMSHLDFRVHAYRHALTLSDQ